MQLLQSLVASKTCYLKDRAEFLGRRVEALVSHSAPFLNLATQRPEELEHNCYIELFAEVLH